MAGEQGTAHRHGHRCSKLHVAPDTCSLAEALCFLPQHPSTTPQPTLGPGLHFAGFTSWMCPLIAQSPIFCLC